MKHCTCNLVSDSDPSGNGRNRWRLRWALSLRRLSLIWLGGSIWAAADVGFEGSNHAWLDGAIGSGVARAQGARSQSGRAGDSSPTPTTLGGSSERARVRSDSSVRVEERKDNVTKKKTALSEREKREAGGRRLSQSEIQRVVGERKLSGALNNEIKYAESVLQKLPRNSPQRPRVLQRLIESYYNKSLLVFFAESRKYDEDWEKWDAGGRKGREPSLDMNRSQEWTAKVAQKAQQMISEYPKDREIDEAYFQVGYALDQLGKRKEAAAYYSQLVARFPNSVRVADSHFALGEFYFDATDFRKALTSFQEASKHTRSSIHPWAVYKTAWCYYNVQDYRNALGAFQNVVRIAATAKKMTAEGRTRLKEEALRDMVNPFAELQDIGGAERYFASVGGEKYFGDLLTKLAEVLREQGQYEKSIAVLKRFIARNPTELTAADIQIQIVDTANLLADKKVLWAELQVLLRNYNPETPWGRRNAAKPEYKELAERVHTVAITYPKQMHADAQKSKNRFLFAQAAVGYELYLSEFPKRPEAEEVRFLLGEIQYEQAKYDEARRVFWSITERDKERKGKNFAKAAQYLLSSAYIPIEDKMRAIRARAAKVGESEKPIDPALLEYLKVCDKIIEWFPSSPSVRDCELDSAEIFLKHNYYAKAEDGLWKIAKKYPKGKEGRDAAGLLLFLASKDPKKLVAIAPELAKISEYKTGDIGKRLAAIDESSKFERTLEIEKAGDYAKAAAAFEQLARSNPKGSETDKAWYNAGLNYKRAGESAKAIAAFTRVYTDFPKATQAPDSQLAVIEIHDSQLKLDQVGAESVRFLQAYPNDKRAPVVRREACLVFAARNDVSGAQKTCGAIVKAGGADVGLAAQTLAQVYRRTGRHADLVAVTDTYLLGLPVSASEKIVFLGQAAEAERKLGRRTKVAGRENQIMGFYNRDRGRISGEALSYVGKIEFDKHQEILRKYSSTKLTARKQDGSDLQASITTKQTLLQNLEKSFQKVIATGDAEWGVAAMVTIGGAWEVFADDLRNAPMPPGVPPEQVKPIKEQIGALAAKPLAKAVEYYKQASAAVSKFGVYNDYSRKNVVALARLDSKNVRELKEWVPDTVFVGSAWSESGSTSRAFKFLGD